MHGGAANGRPSIMIEKNIPGQKNPAAIWLPGC